MKTNAPVPPQVNALVIQDWHAATMRPEGMHIITTFLEEAAPHGVSWLLCYLWAAVRTEFFTAQCYRAHLDVANLGGHYYSYRASVREACAEFAKFDDTSMLQEEPRILAELQSLMNHAIGVNPGGEPVPQPPVPPRPMPLPEPEPPKPAPTPVEEPKPEGPKKPGNWKVILAGIVTTAGVIAAMTPIPWDDLVVRIIKIVLDFF